MDNDDLPVGRILSRREALALLGAAGATLLIGCGPAQPGAAAPTIAPTDVPATAAPPTAATTTAPTAATTTAPTAAATTAPTVAEAVAALACVVRPEQTEGPYFVDTRLNRADIRAEPSDGTLSDGVPLRLTFSVAQVSAAGCTPLEGAVVDIWHCDAQGAYSGVGGAPTAFLRGYQATDAAGRAEFLTIYPGWYRGRAVHIHFKIRTDPDAVQGGEFTSQLYFDDALTDQVHAQPPYAARGQRDRRNADDGIFGQGGEQLTLQLTPDGAGYVAAFDIGVDLS